LERYLSHEDKVVASGAAAGLLTSHVLNGYQDRIWSTLRQRGADALTGAQRQCYAVTSFNGEVNNGGLSQYFFNSSGNEWRAALAGLEAMEFTERQAVLREATAKFGKSGPPVDRGERMEQLSELGRADETLFSELDSRYYRSAEVVDVFVTRYVLKNPEAFR
jgi:hypothetical protein